MKDALETAFGDMATAVITADSAPRATALGTAPGVRSQHPDAEEKTESGMDPNGDLSSDPSDDPNNDAHTDLNIGTDPNTGLGASGKRRSFASRLSVADTVFRTVSYSAGGLTVAIMLAVGLFLSLRAADALSVAGFSFLTEPAWSPETQTFGIAAVLSGTITIALVAMVVSVPLALGTSLLISEIVPPRLKSALVTLVDLMAAVPSVVFGLWGAFFLQANVIPVAAWISTYFGWIPVFDVSNANGERLTDASAFTSSAFIAGIVVGLMVVPTQTSVMREAFSQAPAGEREAALALGSTRWGMIREVVIPFGRGGIIGGTMLGLGRALGETIAVYMIISPVFVINWEVLKTGTNSVSALIALRYGESSEFGLSALMAAGLVLFVITLAINFTASTVVARSRSGAESEA
jgi:phosphate transport system permease protein